MSSRNTASSAFGFVGGLVLEMGAAVALVAVLWQPSTGDARPAVDVVHFGSPPQPFATRDVRTALLPESRGDVFAYQPLPESRIYSQPAPQQQAWQQPQPLLPSASPSWERETPEFRPETRVVTAQPYIRPLRGDRAAIASEPRTYAAPAHRTADVRNNDFYNRY